MLIVYLVDEDFGPPQSHIVTFPTGSRRHSVNIFINDDDIDEGDEKFELEISVPEVAVRAGVIDGCKTSLNVKIIDDDGMLIYNYYVCQFITYVNLLRIKERR